MDVCMDCSAGSYADKSGSTKCTDCSKDYFTNQTGQLTCQACTEGKTTVGVGGKADGIGATGCQVTSIPCQKGQYRNMQSGRCINCDAGKFSSDGRACVSCPVGSYALSKNSSVCTLCPSGRYGIEGELVRSSVDEACGSCGLGKYSAIEGATFCFDCPPGSYCDRDQMNMYVKCPQGKYSDISNSFVCIPCSPGRYQSVVGYAKCNECPAGRFNGDAGSSDIAACTKCSPGKYASNPGFSACIECSVGHFQPDEGASVCNRSCSDEQGRTMTSNDDHTDCVLDSAFASQSLVDTMFDKGIALYVTIGIAMLFVGLVSALQVKKMSEKYVEEVSRLRHVPTIIKVFLWGLVLVQNYS